MIWVSVPADPKYPPGKAVPKKRSIRGDERTVGLASLGIGQCGVKAVKKQTWLLKRMDHGEPAAVQVESENGSGATLQAARQGQGRTGVQLAERWIIAALRHLKFFSARRTEPSHP